ncbi:MAG: hypothetical protein LBC37_08200 [Zoogloeaceae bacterium]|jgi:hypothetical protein|nr:hypothetical protein [Zoogloeaceae bacterium]
MKLFAADLAEFRNQHHGYCARGSRQFAARHRLSWEKFVLEGIEADELLKTGDALAEAFVQWARSRGGNLPPAPTGERDGQ